eukprot:1138248-Pelagomonas_calceolata.AAC.2
MAAAGMRWCSRWAHKSRNTEEQGEGSRDRPFFLRCGSSTIAQSIMLFLLEGIKNDACARRTCLTQWRCRSCCAPLRRVPAAHAIKNDAELDGMREAHLRDAVALCELLYTLEKDVSAEWGHG